MPDNQDDNQDFDVTALESEFVLNANLGGDGLGGHFIFVPAMDLLIGADPGFDDFDDQFPDPCPLGPEFSPEDLEDDFGHLLDEPYDDLYWESILNARADAYYAPQGSSERLSFGRSKAKRFNPYGELNSLGYAEYGSTRKPYKIDCSWKRQSRRRKQW